MVRTADIRRGGDRDDRDAEGGAEAPKNYITPAGYGRLKQELTGLLDRERPELVRTVAWAASNGDRSENADYIYGKRRLREIDRRIRFLTKRIEAAQVIDPARAGLEQVFFGATVTYARDDGSEQTVAIVGQDEVDPARGRVSWISPIARALNKARAGDCVMLCSPAGDETLEVLTVEYVALD
jgi:transcription elongation factor GreB